MMEDIGNKGPPSLPPCLFPTLPGSKISSSYQVGRFSFRAWLHSTYFLYPSSSSQNEIQTSFLRNSFKFLDTWISPYPVWMSVNTFPVFSKVSKVSKVWKVWNMRNLFYVVLPRCATTILLRHMDRSRVSPLRLGVIPSDDSLPTSLHIPFG